MRTNTGGVVGAHPLATVFLVAIVVRGLFVLLFARSPFIFGDSPEYDAIAKALLDGRGLIESSYGGIRPPLYSLFTAATYAIGGTAALQAAQILVGGSTAVLIAALAGLLFDQKARLVAGLLAAVYPWFIFYVGALASETVFTFVAVAAFASIIVARRTGTPGWVVGAGVMFGLATLTRSNMLVLAPFVLVWWWWSSRLSVALTFAAGMVLSLAPFTAYNVVQGNGFAVGATGGGLAFYIGNNPDQTSLYSGQLSEEEWRDLNSREIGPVGMAFVGCAMPCAPLPERDRFFYQAGFRYIVSFPQEWAVTAAKKMLQHWQPWVETKAYPLPVVVLSGASFGLLLILAALGMRRVERADAGIYVVVALGTTLTAVMFLASHRYRFPVLDPLLIAAASGPLSLWSTSLLSGRRVPARAQSVPGVSGAPPRPRPTGQQ